MLALASSCVFDAFAGAVFADPPGFVGRISDVQGEVSFLPPGESFWTDATRNFPVAAGESFWTGDAGRVELQAGPVEARLDSDTELDVLALDYGQVRLALAQGSLDLRLWQVPRGGVTIATPAGEVRFNRQGVYRIDVGASQDDGAYPPVEVTVLEGEAGVPTPEGFSPVDAGTAALLYAGYDADLEDAQDAAIDDWARAREAQEHWDRDGAFSGSLTGYQDLQDQGQFVETPDYGTVWFPREVPADWAPYRDGHWAFVQPWGWTWIDDQPWGFAPFHYGRWAQFDGRWGWVPGTPAPEPVYAPALVAFVGGQGWSIGFGAGGAGEAIGWVPLAPDEVYRPSYRVSPTYLRQINVANVRQTTINNITINNVVNITQYRNAPAATVVRSASFARGETVKPATSPVSLAVLAHAPPAQGFVPAPAAPARSSAPSADGGSNPRLGVASPGARAAPPPPARLQAVRAAVAAQPPNSNRPPTIQGARMAPAPPPRTGGAAAFIAPAAVKNPAAQGLKPVPHGLDKAAGNPPAPQKSGTGSNANWPSGEASAPALARQPAPPVRPALPPAPTAAQSAGGQPGPLRKEQAAAPQGRADRAPESGAARPTQAEDRIAHETVTQPGGRQDSGVRSPQQHAAEAPQVSLPDKAPHAPNKPPAKAKAAPSKPAEPAYDDKARQQQ